MSAAKLERKVRKNCGEHRGGRREDCGGGGEHGDLRSRLCHGYPRNHGERFLDSPSRELGLNWACERGSGTQALTLLLARHNLVQCGRRIVSWPDFSGFPSDRIDCTVIFRLRFKDTDPGEHSPNLEGQLEAISRGCRCLLRA